MPKSLLPTETSKRFNFMEPSFPNLNVHIRDVSGDGTTIIRLPEKHHCWESTETILSNLTLNSKPTLRKILWSTEILTWRKFGFKSLKFFVRKSIPKSPKQTQRTKKSKQLLKISRFKLKQLLQSKILLWPYPLATPFKNQKKPWVQLTLSPLFNPRTLLLLPDKKSQLLLSTRTSSRWMDLLLGIRLQSLRKAFNYKDSSPLLQYWLKLWS